MFRSGSFVAEHISDLTKTQVQPNGVDLTVGKIYKQIESGYLGKDTKRIAEREEISPTDGSYMLSPGVYIVQYQEIISIPDGHVGFVYPRSTLMRNSGMINTAVWDAGYEGRGEGLLTVNTEIEIATNARIAQIVYSEANHESQYDGSYQKENI